MYFHDSQLIFLHPTKTGGSTVELYLMQALKDSVTPHVYESLQYLNEDGYDERHDVKTQVMFGNYRDSHFPGGYSLQHACIFTARRLLGNAAFEGSRKIAMVRNPYARILSLYFFYGFDTQGTFATFVQDTLPVWTRSSSEFAVNLAAKQALYTHQDGACAVDLVLRQECMEESVSSLARFLGVQIDYEKGTRLRGEQGVTGFRELPGRI